MRTLAESILDKNDYCIHTGRYSKEDVLNAMEEYLNTVTSQKQAMREFNETDYETEYHYNQGRRQAQADFSVNISAIIITSIIVCGIAYSIFHFLTN